LGSVDWVAQALVCVTLLVLSDSESLCTVVINERSPVFKDIRPEKLLQSVYCTVDGAGIVSYKVGKYRHTKAFKCAPKVG